MRWQVCDLTDTTFTEAVSLHRFTVLCPVSFRFGIDVSKDWTIELGIKNRYNQLSLSNPRDAPLRTQIKIRS